MQADLSTSVENEWLCSKIIKQFDIPIAHCDIGQFEDQKVLIIERFDRVKSEGNGYWIRKPQEDMCQALGFPPSLKYEADGGPGINKIARLLLSSRNAQQDRRVFLRAQIIFWMLCAPDGHAKNFSIFLENRGRFSMAPLYDVISAFPILGNKAKQIPRQKVRLAMAAIGKNRHYNWAEIYSRHWMSTAKAIGLDGIIEQELEFIQRLTPALVKAVSRELPGAFPASVADTIFEGMLAMSATIKRG
jgi:serine/threonine-protein kinase HipA